MKNIIIISLMLALSLNSFGQEQDTSYWTNSGLGALNFSQVSLTNWAGGGQNSISATALLNLRANYAKGNNSWDNVLDLALGGIKQGDNASFIKTDDNIDFTSKYGYKLNKNFHFTVLDNFRTQFTEGFNITDTDTTRISNLFAPAYNLFAMGIDYKPSDNFSVFVSPITAKTTIVNDDALSAAGAYGVEEGETFRNEVGGYLNMSFKTEVVKNVSFQTKLGIFSNYANNPQNIDINWETLISMKVNKFLSASITTNLIYDDDIDIGIDEDDDGIVDKVGPRVQFKEVLGIGISCKF